MPNKRIDKLAERLSKDVAHGVSGDDSFSDLADIDLDSISAAHVSDHGSVHFSQPGGGGCEGPSKGC